MELKIIGFLIQRSHPQHAQAVPQNCQGQEAPLIVR